MKIPIAVSLVIVGGFLIAVPLIADYFHRQQIVAATRKPRVNSVVLKPNLTAPYHLGCWFTGTAAIAAAICFSRRSSGASTVS
jgi:hypothetical protein